LARRPLETTNACCAAAGGRRQQTRVTVVHGTFARVVDISDYPFGWGSFLQALKGLLEK
jgi:hypothetical protein